MARGVANVNLCSPVPLVTSWFSMCLINRRSESIIECRFIDLNPRPACDYVCGAAVVFLSSGSVNELVTINPSPFASLCVALMDSTVVKEIVVLPVLFMSRTVLAACVKYFSTDIGAHLGWVCLFKCAMGIQCHVWHVVRAEHFSGGGNYQLTRYEHVLVAVSMSLLMNKHLLKQRNLGLPDMILLCMMKNVNLNFILQVSFLKYIFLTPMRAGYLSSKGKLISIPLAIKHFCLNITILSSHTVTALGFSSPAEADKEPSCPHVTQRIQFIILTGPKVALRHPSSPGKSIPSAYS